MTTDELLIQLIEAVNRNTAATENLDDTNSRLIKSQSKYTGVLDRTTEAQELKRIRKKVVGGSGGKSLEFAQKLLAKRSA